eukprot:7586550-Alexandrium_andersonii.AAC.1
MSRPRPSSGITVPHPLPFGLKASQEQDLLSQPGVLDWQGARPTACIGLPIGASVSAPPPSGAPRGGLGPLSA